MGHVHLKVADLEKARAFYLDTLGLNLMFDASHMGALFVAAGSYHHHLGLNTWQSKGHLADAKALGLDYYVIHVPDSDSLKRLKENLEQSHYEFIYQDNTITLDDPAGNTLKITLK